MNTLELEQQGTLSAEPEQGERIAVKPKEADLSIYTFLAVSAILCVASFWVLDVDLGKIVEIDGAHTAKISEWNVIEQKLMKIEKCRQTKNCYIQTVM